MTQDPLKCHCPCCGAALTVDPQTAQVLFHKPTEKKQPINFDDATLALRQEKGLREEAFRKSLSLEKNKAGLLKKKFDEAFKHAQEHPEERPPTRDIDLD